MVDTEQKTAQIFQSCLEAIETGNETLDSVLSQYPELEDELRPELENAMWLMSHRPMLDPDPQFVSRSRRRLMARIQAEQREAATAPSIKSALRTLLNMPSFVMRAAAALVLVVILLLGADGLVERTSSAIPGDAGYNVKRTVENLTLAVSPDPGQQVVLHLEYSQRRLSEANTLVDKARYTDATVSLDEFETQVRGAVNSLDSVRDEDTVHKELLAMTIQEKLADHTKQLSTLLPKVPSDTQPAVARAMMVSNDGVSVASTAIKRLMTMYTPQPSDLLPTDTESLGSTLEPNVTPTEGVIYQIIPSSTEEFKQIFSSTVAPPPAPTQTRESKPALPTFPVIGPTATPPAPTPPDNGGPPTAVPTVIPPTSTPLPPSATSASPTLSGVSTSTPAGLGGPTSAPSQSPSQSPSVAAPGQTDTVTTPQPVSTPTP